MGACRGLYTSKSVGMREASLLSDTSQNYHIITGLVQ